MQKIFIFALLSLAFLSSCEKEIQITVDDADAKFVIEANLNQNPGSAIVKITKSIGFSDQTTVPTVHNALVTITHNGQIDTLTETGDGIYTHPTLAATLGQTYFIEVQPDANNSFSAACTMPSTSPFDSIRQENLTTDSIGGFRPRPNPQGEVFVSLTPIFTDDPNAVNFYQFYMRKNDSLTDRIIVLDDQITNGQTNGRPVFLETKAGDSITIELQAIDQANYNYFFGLDETISQSSAAPANPPTNLSNGALGYFKVCHTQSRFIIIR